MRPFVKCRALTALGLPSLMLALVLGSPKSAPAQPICPFTFNPVEPLRLVLRAPVHDEANRLHEVRQAIGQLQDLTNLMQALSLKEWRDLDVDGRIAAIDRQLRAVVLQTFMQEIREVFKHGSPQSQVIGLDYLAQMAATTRGIGTRDGMGRLFSTDVVNLIHQGDPQVREAAVRALGQINSDPAEAAPILRDLLGSPQPSEHITATRALLDLIEKIIWLVDQGNNPAEVWVPSEDVLQVALTVVAIAGEGLHDEHNQVRLGCAMALGRAAHAWSRLIAIRMNLDETSNSPSGEKTRDEVRRLLHLFKEEGPALAATLEDPDPQVRFRSRQALEEIAHLRLRLLQRETGVTESSGNPSKFAGSEDPLLEGLRTTVPALARALADVDARARRHLVDILEIIGPAAREATPALVDALADSDRFVRWAAARALGKLGPSCSETAVPALASLLTDTDPDIRLAAATALEQWGPACRTALPNLIRAVEDRAMPEVRLVVMRILARLGSREAVPALCSALADPDEQVRSMAAYNLGLIGPAAGEAVNALRQVHADPSPRVQSTASQALLRILQPASPVMQIEFVPQ